MNKKKLRKIQAILNPEKAVKLELQNLAEDIKAVEAKIPPQKDYSPAIQNLRQEMLSYISELPDFTEIKNLRAEFETKLASLEKENIEPIQTQIQDVVSNDITSDEDLKKELKEKIGNLRTEFLNRLRNLGGGQAAPRIQVNGTTMSTRYADINFKGAMSAADNNTTKQVDITVAGIGGLIPSGTSGSVLFIDSNGNLAQDNTNLFWDNTNKRLGVQTNNPGGTLEIDSTSNSIPVLKLLSTQDSPELLFTSSVAPTGSLQGSFFTIGLVSDTSHPVQSGDALGTFQFKGQGNDASFAMPFARGLVITGNTDRSSTTVDLLLYSKPSGNTSSVERMRIANTGNIGIGVSSPTLGRLQIITVATNTVGLVLDTQASQTAAAMQCYYNGTASGALTYQANATFMGLAGTRNFGDNNYGPWFQVGRNSNAGTHGPVNGVMMWSGNTNDSFLWADQSRILRIHSAAPTGSANTPTVDETAGTIVGTQTSWYLEKNIIGERTDTRTALDAILNTKIYDFTYKDSSLYDSSNKPHRFTGVVVFDEDRKNNAWFAMNLGNQQIPALNSINALGYTVLAIKDLNSQVQTLQKQVAALMPPNSSNN